jgi:hypothetical protein
MPSLKIRSASLFAIRCVLRESRLAHDHQSCAQLRTVKCQESLHKTMNAVRLITENIGKLSPRQDWHLPAPRADIFRI